MPSNDPLTSLDAMISMIEPGFRMIDGSLLKELYSLAGLDAQAALIEPGFRLIDATLLVELASTIPDPVLEQDFVNAMVGPRLIDGEPWKELALELEVPPVVPPVNITVPQVTGTGIVGDPLVCTMGIWEGEPDSYSYQWQSDGSPVGTDQNSYIPVAGDEGNDVGCVVTATNSAGSTAAPLSNTITIIAATEC